MSMKDKIALTCDAVIFCLIVGGMVWVGMASGRLDAGMDRTSIHGKP